MYKIASIAKLAKSDKQKELMGRIMYCLDKQPTAYNVDKVVEEVKKIDLDGVSMVEDGKYKLVRKNEVISLIQTNGVCNGRHTTCADCYKMNCPLSTEKTFADKWSEQVRKGGVE
jgi:hypothetical protein